jgi:hypothetical protein
MPLAIANNPQQRLLRADPLPSSGRASELRHALGRAEDGAQLGDDIGREVGHVDNHVGVAVTRLHLHGSQSRCFVIVE